MCAEIEKMEDCTSHITTAAAAAREENVTSRYCSCNRMRSEISHDVRASDVRALLSRAYISEDCVMYMSKGKAVAKVSFAGKKWRANRLFCHLFKTEVGDADVVHAVCGTTGCVRISHLIVSRNGRTTAVEKKKVIKKR
jgi:hypothetical protein